MPKAPPITRENAREFALKSNAIQKARREEFARLSALATRATDDYTRKARVLKQIDILLADMELAKSFQMRAKISAALERLWKLVQPTAGALRPGRGSRRADAPEAPMPMRTPQEPTISPPTTIS